MYFKEKIWTYMMAVVVGLTIGHLLTKAVFYLVDQKPNLPEAIITVGPQTFPEAELALNSAGATLAIGNTSLLLKNRKYWGKEETDTCSYDVKTKDNSPAPNGQKYLFFKTTYRYLRYLDEESTSIDPILCVRFSDGYYGFLFLIPSGEDKNDLIELYDNYPMDNVALAAPARNTAFLL